MKTRIVTGVFLVVVLGALVAATPFIGARQVRDTAAPKGPAGTSISGTVVSDEPASHPLRRAVVTVSGGSLRGGRQTVTDDQGRFQITGVPGGEYTLSAAKGGWLTTYYGSTKPGRPPSSSRLNVNESGPPLTGLTLRMMHGAAITGTIVDPNGRPADVTVQVHQVRTERNGRRVAVESGLVMSVSVTEVTSDDRGTYRLYGLPPGDYLVVASSFELSNANSEAFVSGSTTSSPAPAPGVTTGRRPSLPRQGQPVTFADVYFPGTTDPNSAAIVTLGPGEEKSGVNFALQLVPTARISGTLVGVDGQPAPNGQVLLIPHAILADAGGLDAGFMGAGDRYTGLLDGKFSIPSVPPGDYTIVARAPERSANPPASGRAAPAPPEFGRGGAAGGQPTTFGMTDVTVNGQDIPNLTLSLQRGPTVSGRVRFDGASTAPDSLSARVGLTAQGPLVTPSTPALVTNGGTFSFQSLMPGRYRVAIPMLPSGWRLASVTAGGVDVTDAGLDVRLGENITDVTIQLTDRIAEISGVLQDRSGQAVTDRVIVAFPVDPALWTSARRVRPPVGVDRGGAFRIRDLPPGEYWLAVATDLDGDDLADTRVLEQLAAAAVRVALADGEKKVQNLVVR